MFEKAFPNLKWWIENQGWIALGADEMSYSLLRVLDPGGTCWEDQDSSDIEEALEKAELWASKEIEDRLGEEPPKRYDKN